jgi:hypothetical protein
MARVALIRKSGRSVIRIRRLVEVRHVAARAIRRDSHELPAHVAGRAIHFRVRARQLEGAQVVIELCVLPGGGGVAGVALGGKAGLRVRRVVGLLEIRDMATRTVRGRPGQPSQHMAGRALYAHMRSR